MLWDRRSCPIFLILSLSWNQNNDSSKWGSAVKRTYHLIPLLDFLLKNKLIDSGTRRYREAVRGHSKMPPKTWNPTCGFDIPEIHRAPKVLSSSALTWCVSYPKGKGPHLTSSPISKTSSLSFHALPNGFHLSVCPHNFFLKSVKVLSVFCHCKASPHSRCWFILFFSANLMCLYLACDILPETEEMWAPAASLICPVSGRLCLVILYY